jgi:hypothetical protein
MGAIEIGLGGDLGEYWKLPLGARIAAVRAELAERDPAARIAFLMGLPAPDVAREAADLGMPYRMAGDLYVLPGDHRRPPALQALRHDLARARATGTVDTIVMQVDGDRGRPTTAELVAFYGEAYAMADDHGVRLDTETHIDRWTYDPRRVAEVDRALRSELGRGLTVCADFSHYAHQIGNHRASNWDAIAAGELVLDPAQAGDHVTTRIIAPGLVRSGHLRCAAPNDLPRGMGSIQYPLVDPDGDPRQATPVGALRHHGPWRAERTGAWCEMNRRVFARQLADRAAPVARFASEFICCEDEYRMDPYRNVYQNLAAIAWACAEVRALSSASATAAKG